MNTIRLACIGFGNVGQGMVTIIRDKKDFFAKHFNTKLKIVAISTLSRGCIYDPDGFDPNALLTAIETDGNLHNVPAAVSDWDAATIIEQANADVVVETSYTDLQTGEPALSYIRQALKRGMDVVTSNKGPIALNYRELCELAKEHNARIGIEGTVMSGTPVLSIGLDLLAGAEILGIQGILNSTTNYILTEMEKGINFSTAIENAQSLGYAEANPTGDIEGYDTAAKIVILSNCLMNNPIGMEDVDRTGLSTLALEEIEKARESGNHWKLVGSLTKTPDGITANVKPSLLPPDNPLATVGGVTNKIIYSTNILGDITIVGPGAGRLETGYALIRDMLSFCSSD